MSRWWILGLQNRLLDQFELLRLPHRILSTISLSSPKFGTSISSGIPNLQRRTQLKLPLHLRSLKTHLFLLLRPPLLLFLHPQLQHLELLACRHLRFSLLDPQLPELPRRLRPRFPSPDPPEELPLLSRLLQSDLQLLEVRLLKQS